MEILLSQPRGFCAGVIRAIQIIEQALVLYGPPIYVRHEIVHNARVISELSAKGVIFVKELDQVPTGARVVFSAHGVARTVEKEAASREMLVLDATCPLVKKVHNQIVKYAAEMVGSGDGGVESSSGKASATAGVSNVEWSGSERNEYNNSSGESVDERRGVAGGRGDNNSGGGAVGGEYNNSSGVGISEDEAAGTNAATAARKLLIIGHRNHPEVIGTIGQVAPYPVTVIETCDDVRRLNFSANQPLAYVTQTTLSVDDTAAIIAALHERFHNLSGPSLSDICYATQNRQQAVKDLAPLVDLILVVGSANSSNSNRLCDIARDTGCPAYLVDNRNEIDFDWLIGKNRIGITAGASAPEVLVEEIITAISERYPDTKVRTIAGKEETVVFQLPRELRGDR